MTSRTLLEAGGKPVNRALLASSGLFLCVALYNKQLLPTIASVASASFALLRAHWQYQKASKGSPKRLSKIHRKFNQIAGIYETTDLKELPTDMKARLEQIKARLKRKSLQPAPPNAPKKQPAEPLEDYKKKLEIWIPEAERLLKPNQNILLGVLSHL